MIFICAVVVFAVLDFSSFGEFNKAFGADLNFAEDFFKCANLFNAKNGLPSGYEYSYNITNHVQDGNYKFVISKDNSTSSFRRLYFFVEAQKIGDSRFTHTIKVQCDVLEHDVGMMMYYDGFWHEWISSKGKPK